MDQAAHGKQKSLRQEALEEIHGVKWILLGEDRMYEMIEKRPTVRFRSALGRADHCFLLRCLRDAPRGFHRSAQRREWFEKEGADAWYEHTPEELLPAGTLPCGAQNGARKTNSRRVV